MKPLKVDSNLVLVPVTVTDREGRIITSLDRQNFAIFEDKEQQELRNIHCDDAPVSVGIIFDQSGSMKDKLDNAREAVVQFMLTANPEDEFFVIGVSDRPLLLMDYTNSPGRIQEELVFRAAGGTTALLDAIYLGVQKLSSAKHARKALLVVSDGGDNHSRYEPGQIKQLIRESDVEIFAIGTFDGSTAVLEEANGPDLLDSITKMTGGLMFVSDRERLPSTAEEISRFLRDRYVLAYVPANKPRDGKWHKIKIKLFPSKKLGGLTVRAKNGYYAR